MDGADDLYLVDNPDSTEELPLLDIGPYLRGEPGAKKRIAAELREVSETVGFFYLAGHGVEQSLVDQTFEEARRLHALSAEAKARIPKVERVGYHSLEQLASDSPAAGTPTASLTNTYVLHRDLPPNHSRLVPNHPFWGPNVWPEDLPGFRENVLHYYKTIEALGKKMMPLWAASLDLPDDYFDKAFADPYMSIRLAHYPPQKEVGNRKYGISPHSDNSTMTILAQANVPGLAVEMPSGHWRIADIVPGTFMVNTGNTMVRFTNGRYLSTKHRVINKASVDRYSIPVFFGPHPDAMIETVPTCLGPNGETEFPPIKYEDLMQWYFIDRGYDKKAEGPDTEQRGRWVE